MNYVFMENQNHPYENRTYMSMLNKPKEHTIKLINAGVDLEKPVSCCGNQSLISAAIEYEHLDIAQLLLDKNINNINHSTSDALSALESSLMCNKIGVRILIKKLIYKGADARVLNEDNIARLKKYSTPSAVLSRSINHLLKINDGELEKINQDLHCLLSPFIVKDLSKIVIGYADYYQDFVKSHRNEMLIETIDDNVAHAKKILNEYKRSGK